MSSRHVVLGFVALLLWLISFGVRGDQNPAQIIGVASVIDGDTIEIHGTRFRLEGIDAPESDQMCTRGSAGWACGRESAMALADFIGRSSVTCQVVGQDKYRRSLDLCRVHQRDVGDFMVREGWAIAYRKYSPAYIEAEQEAQERKRNLWSGQFEAPWDNRARKRGVAPSP
jgi:endonuclease YncB( thermonuclease family)